MSSAALSSLLLGGKLKEAQGLVVNASPEHIKSNCLDLIATVAHLLIENVGKEEFVDCCETIVCHIAETGVPKEVLVGILEQISIAEDDTVFLIFLKSLEVVLLKLSSQRGKTLKWALDTVHSYIAKLPLPESCGYEGEERMLLDLDPNVHKTTQVVRHYLNFLKPFVEEVSLLSPKKKAFPERTAYQRDILSHHLLLVLDHSLAYLDLSHEDTQSESLSRACAVKVMTYLRQLKGNSLDLYAFAHSYTEHDNDLGEHEVSTVATSTLAYLIVKERLGNLPCVFAPLYLFKSHLEFCAILLSNNDDLVQYKGLHLLESIIEYTDASCLPKEFLDHPHLPKLQQGLITIMIYSSIDEYRQHAFRLFKSFLEKLDSKAKCLVSLNLLSSERHAGVRGLVVTSYKDNLHQAMTLQEENPFLSHNLKMFLHFATKLPQNVETDLLEESDCIFATLNFLRYLVMRDPRDINATGVWTLMEGLKTEYLETLRTGLNLSRAHYKQKAMEELRDGKKNLKSPETVLQVGNQKLPNLPEKHNLQVLQSALLTFELLESVIVRLEENL